MTLATALDQVRDARSAGVTLPLAVMTYVNPVLSFGIDAFAGAAAAAGIDGAIVPDLPLDEAAGYARGDACGGRRGDPAGGADDHARTGLRASAQPLRGSSTALVSPA